MVNSISIEEFIKIMDRVNIIDVRNIESYNNGHIDRAINIPFNQLIIAPQKYLLKDRIYYLYCTKSTKSIKACQILSNQGYKVVNIMGGYQAWILQK